MTSLPCLPGLIGIVSPSQCRVEVDHTMSNFKCCCKSRPIIISYFCWSFVDDASIAHVHVNSRLEVNSGRSNVIGHSIFVTKLPPLVAQTISLSTLDFRMSVGNTLCLIIVRLQPVSTNTFLSGILTSSCLIFTAIIVVSRAFEVSVSVGFVVVAKRTVFVLTTLLLGKPLISNKVVNFINFCRDRGFRKRIGFFNHVRLRLLLSGVGFFSLTLCVSVTVPRFSTFLSTVVADFFPFSPPPLRGGLPLVPFLWGDSLTRRRCVIKTLEVVDNKYIVLDFIPLIVVPVVGGQWLRAWPILKCSITDLC